MTWSTADQRSLKVRVPPPPGHVEGPPPGPMGRTSDLRPQALETKEGRVQSPPAQELESQSRGLESDVQTGREDNLPNLKGEICGHQWSSPPELKSPRPEAMGGERTDRCHASWVDHADVTGYDPAFEDSSRNRWQSSLARYSSHHRTRGDGAGREEPVRAGERFPLGFQSQRGSGKDSQFQRQVPETRMEMSSR